MADVVEQRRVVIVSGAPGAGKSTLAVSLAKALGFPLLSKDVIKETIFDAVGDFRGNLVETSDALDPAAMSLLWRLAVDSPQIVLEANFKPINDDASNLSRLDARLVEVYCRVAPEVALERYNERGRRRDRHHVHYLRQTSLEILGQYQTPVDVGSVIEVDTTHPVDVDAVANQVRSLFDAG